MHVVTPPSSFSVLLVPLQEFGSFVMIVMETMGKVKELRGLGGL